MVIVAKVISSAIRSVVVSVHCLSMFMKLCRTVEYINQSSISWTVTFSHCNLEELFFTSPLNYYPENLFSSIFKDILTFCLPFYLFIFARQLNWYDDRNFKLIKETEFSTSREERLVDLFSISLLIEISRCYRLNSFIFLLVFLSFLLPPIYNILLHFYFFSFYKFTFFFISRSLRSSRNLYSLSFVHLAI